MKKISFLASALLLSAVSWSQTGFTPPIRDYGKIREVPFAVDKPDPSLQYKIIMEISEKIEDSTKIYAPLDHAARMYNLHVYGGVPQKQLDVAVVIWGAPVSVILNDEAYKKKYGVDNPNTKLIAALREAGVKLFACGQSIQKYKVDPATVNPDIKIAVSRFTTVSTYQLKGYAFFAYD